MDGQCVRVEQGPEELFGVHVVDDQLALFRSSHADFGVVLDEDVEHRRLEVAERPLPEQLALLDFPDDAGAADGPADHELLGLVAFEGADALGVVVEFFEDALLEVPDAQLGERRLPCRRCSLR